MWLNGPENRQSLASEGLAKGLGGSYGPVKGRSSAPYGLGKGQSMVGLVKYGQALGVTSLLFPCCLLFGGSTGV